MSTPNSWFETPLLPSPYAASRLGTDVYLKLENLQHSHSFKFRGISAFAQQSLDERGPGLRLIVASGGNAACATCVVAKAMGLPCTAFVPESAKGIVPLLSSTGANVRVGGRNYFEALGAAQEAVSEDPNAVLVPAYDHQTLWEGHSSLVKEIASQLPPNIPRPGVIVCAVGGGGLLGGTILGCKDLGWDEVPILAMETHGSNCFYQTMFANSAKQTDAAWGNAADVVDEGGLKIAHLQTLTSRAICLGAMSPSAGVVRLALERKGPVHSVCVSDEMSMLACIKFLQEHKMAVELACATALSPLHDARIFKEALGSDKVNGPVVVVVCGGIGISLKELAEYEQLLSGRDPLSENLWVDGRIVN